MGTPPIMLDGFVDTLLQGFENRRAGLSDQQTAAGGPAAEALFADLYAKERSSLHQAVAAQFHLGEEQRARLEADVDDLVRRVVIPAYTRLAARFTARERNDFYLAPPSWHGAERLGWGLGGLLAGAFVVWAPFIPIWSKEWIAVFMLAGFVFPDLRRALAYRRYQAQLLAVVRSANAEIFRLDVALSSTEIPASPLPDAPVGDRAEAPRPRGRTRS